MPEKEFAAYALVISVTGISKIVTFARNGVSEHPFMKRLLSVPIVESIRDSALTYYMLYLRQQQEFITGRVS